MLQFQAESAQRTKIRDAAADFDIAATVTDRWASKEERERAVMRLKEEARKEEERKRIRVVDLDLEKLGFNEASLPDDPPKPAKVVIPTNFAREDPVVKAAEPEDEDIGRIRRNPTIAAPPIFIPPGSVAKPKARKKMIWEKSKETPESEPAKPVVRAERQRKGGGKWARIQHELDPGGFDFGDDVDDILEGTEVDCG